MVEGEEGDRFDVLILAQATDLCPLGAGGAQG